MCLVFNHQYLDILPIWGESSTSLLVEWMFVGANVLNSKTEASIYPNQLKLYSIMHNSRLKSLLLILRVLVLTWRLEQSLEAVQWTQRDSTSRSFCAMQLFWPSLYWVMKVAASSAVLPLVICLYPGLIFQMHCCFQALLHIH